MVGWGDDDAWRWWSTHQDSPTPHPCSLLLCVMKAVRASPAFIQFATRRVQRLANFSFLVRWLGLKTGHVHPLFLTRWCCDPALVPSCALSVSHMTALPCSCQTLLLTSWQCASYESRWTLTNAQSGARKLTLRSDLSEFRCKEIYTIECSIYRKQVIAEMKS